MSHGVFVNGQRPKSKKAIKEAIASGATVELENTSMFGGHGYTVVGGALVPECGDGTPVTRVRVDFVGPDPYNSRKFYGTVEARNGKVIVK